jgi:sugar lactone lactonase YvrE
MLCSSLSLALACGDDDDGVVGSAGRGGGAGSSGAGGRAGSAGMGGTSGTAGRAGAGGGGGGQGPSGTLQVLARDPALRAPTTAAVRGDDLWVVNGQLGGLFGGAAPVLPFNLVSVPLTGGAIGSAAVELPGNDFYPEGIAAAPDGTLYVGSLNTGVIVRVPADSLTASVFVPAGVAERGVVGLTVDQARGLLWFCDSNPLAPVPGGDIVGVSLGDGTERYRHAMPNPGTSSAGDAGADDGDAGDAGAPAPSPAIATFCNDVIVGPTGIIYATDSSGRIFRVPADSAESQSTAEAWLSIPEIAPPMPGGFGANGLDLVGNQLVIANGNLVAVDPDSNNPGSTARVFTLTLDGEVATLCGADGLQTVPGSTSDIVVVENGNCANAPGGDGDRVVRVTLDL